MQKDHLEEMAKRLKLRLTRILHSCRSRNDPSLPQPIPSSSAVVNPSTSSAARIQTFCWEQEEDFHVVSISNSWKRPTVSSSDSTAAFTPLRPSLAPQERGRRVKRQRRKKHSCGNCDDTVKLCCSGAAEIEDDDDGRSDPIGCIRGKKQCDLAAARGLLPMSRQGSKVEFEARLLAVERRLLCGGGGLGRTEAEQGWQRRTRARKVRDSYTVVKRTQDPYVDFGRSKMEMVTAKEMNDEEELRELLWCLVLLNGREHHGIILRAFAKVWDALFQNKMRLRSAWDLDLGSLALISN